MSKYPTRCECDSALQYGVGLYGGAVGSESTLCPRQRTKWHTHRLNIDRWQLIACSSPLNNTTTRSSNLRHHERATVGRMDAWPRPWPDNGVPRPGPARPRHRSKLHGRAFTQAPQLPVCPSLAGSLSTPIRRELFFLIERKKPAELDGPRERGSRILVGRSGSVDRGRRPAQTGSAACRPTVSDRPTTNSCAFGAAAAIMNACIWSEIYESNQSGNARSFLTPFGHANTQPTVAEPWISAIFTSLTFCMHGVPHLNSLLCRNSGRNQSRKSNRT